VIARNIADGFGVIIRHKAVFEEFGPFVRVDKAIAWLADGGGANWESNSWRITAIGFISPIASGLQQVGIEVKPGIEPTPNHLLVAQKCSKRKFDHFGRRAIAIQQRGQRAPRCGCRASPGEPRKPIPT
jgi:hypothetical protein